MMALSEAQPNDVLCGPFRADPAYYIVLTNLERVYWNRPPLPKAIAEEFLANMQGAEFEVEWRCSTMARLPSLLIVAVHDVG